MTSKELFAILNWSQRYKFYWFAVPFGYRHGSGCMQRVTDSIRAIMHKEGFFITNYIDDLIGCDEPQVAIASFQFLKKLIVDLGLVISESKLFVPQKCIPCLGIYVDIDMGIILIPNDKLNEIIALWLVQCLPT